VAANPNCAPAGRAVGRKVPAGRKRAGEKTRAVWGIHRLLGISEMQVHAAITMGIKCPKCNEGEFVKRGSMGKGGRGRFRRVLRLLALPRIAILRHRLCRLRNRVRNAARRLWWRRRRRSARSAPALKKDATGEKLAPEEKPAEKPAVAHAEEPAPVGVKG